MTAPGSNEAAPLYPRATYVRELRAALPASAFDPATTRIVRIPALLAVIVGSIWAVATGRVPWWGLPLASLVIGSAFAFLTFVSHELLHGGIVRDKRVQIALGWIGFAPFVVSPHLWIAWHNRTHHANTAMPDDPDAYATLDLYAARATTRFSVDVFSLGARRLRGVLSLLFGFTGQSLVQLLTMPRGPLYSRRDQILAWIETGLGVALWTAVALIVGLVPFLFVFALPLVIANTWVMMYILTNHSLSPRTAINDPLVNSLSVTNSRLVSWLTIDFGYHVEHHLFPAMSSRHARTVRALVEERWPERYQTMPMWRALGQLHRTARVYQDSNTLFDPKTQRSYPTLQPRAAQPTATAQLAPCPGLSSIVTSSPVALPSLPDSLAASTPAT